MTAAVAIVLALVLAAIAALHAYWGFGGLWPASDQETLVRAVVGRAGRRRMPPQAITFAVAFAVTVAAALPLLLGGLLGTMPQWLPAVGFAAALVFVARGIAGWTPAWRRLWPAEPFATRDRQIYSPLCLAIGAGFGWLSVQGGLR